ncbi:MAG TPA: GMC oxidoreductase [Lapillicoccus sp.]|nr:GMC oxidoreductase [Lapillicoccus sp.]
MILSLCDTSDVSGARPRRSTARTKEGGCARRAGAPSKEDLRLIACGARCTPTRQGLWPNVLPPVGSCAMGGQRPVGGRPDLRVHGMEGLRVVDASVMPGLSAPTPKHSSRDDRRKAVDLITGRERYSLAPEWGTLRAFRARPPPTSATAVQATNATRHQRNPGNTMNRED